jgi:molybdopterin converting factor small subunit
MATIKIPPVLRPSVGGEREISADGSSVGEILRSLADSHPETKTQLFGADGALNRYVNVYLNDEDVRVLDGLETSVGASDTLVILPAMVPEMPVRVAPATQIAPSSSTETCTRPRRCSIVPCAAV